MKNILILIGGWHFPYKFYEQISKVRIPNGYNVKKVIVSHRNIEDDIVFEEKINYLNKNKNLHPADRELYSQKLYVKDLEKWNISYKEYPNVIGDFYFISQYFSDHTEIPDYLFFFHDDNYISNLNIITDIIENNVDSYFFMKENEVTKIKNDEWIHVGNCFYENTFTPRGSFNVFKKELLINMNSFLKFDNISLHRTNLNYSPSPENTTILSNWNGVCGNFAKYMDSNKLKEKSYRLSATRRFSEYLLECQRGFLTDVNRYEH